MNQYINRLKELDAHLTYSIKTYGCQMNVDDSNRIRTVMDSCGFIYSDDIFKSNISLINTCCVRENAENKALGLIGNLKKQKQDNKNKVKLIIVLGCMVQQDNYADELMSQNKFINAVLGTSDSDKLPECIYNILENHTRVNCISDPTKMINENLHSYRDYRVSEFVTIMTGCNNFCTYCAVPYVRGRERSRQAKYIINDINNLVNNGVKEIVLLGQNVNSYGLGLDEGNDFSDLINIISAETDVKRIRFMTSHPKDLSDKLINTIADNKKVSKHLHLPLQSGSSRILKAMNRHYTKKDYLGLASRIKESVPDIALTTDIIVGFPGEEDVDYRDTVDVVNQVQYTSAFMFKYSKRRSTPAGKMNNQIDEDTKDKRLQHLLGIQESISKKISTEYIGKTVSVLIESDITEKNKIIGKSSQNMTIFTDSLKGHKIGDIVEVKVSSSRNHSLIGEIIDK